MYIIRPTASLAKRMRVKRADPPGKSTSRLGDWYANDIVVGRRQFILCLSENGRLPVLLPAAPYGELGVRLPGMMREVLRAIGVSDADAEREVSEMNSLEFAKTANRSIMGTMNDQRFQLFGLYETGRFVPDAPVEMSLYLANTISLTPPAGTPMEKVRMLFGARAAPALRILKPVR